MADENITEQHRILLDNPAASRCFGRLLGRIARAGDVICLHGSLGAGKTFLTQAIAEGLNIAAEYYVTSPSFALMHEYPGRLVLYHIDCYRLQDEDDVEAAGLMDAIEGGGLAVIEWPERLGSLTPRKRLDIILKITGEENREMFISPQGEAWVERIEAVSNFLLKFTVK